MRDVVDLVSIGCWNIHGLFISIDPKSKICKLKDDEFIKRLQCYDILCLQEIKCGQKDTQGLTVDGYHLYPFHRKISKNNRYFGGSLIFIKNSIKKGVSFVKNFKGDITWVKLDKTFFGLRKNLSICFAYAPPLNSPYLIENDLDVLDIVEKDISLYSNSEYVLIAGDFNAKTKTESDCVSDHDDDHSPINQSDLYISDNCVLRRNCDSHPVDEQGKIFLELCKNSRIRILNGRMPGDRLGAYTRYPLSLRETPSTLDYMASDEELFEKIKSFVVLPYNGLSDHDCLRVTIECKIESFAPEEAINIVKQQRIKYATPEQFRMKLDSPLAKQK